MRSFNKEQLSYDHVSVDLSYVKKTINKTTRYQNISRLFSFDTLIQITLTKNFKINDIS